MSPTGAREEHRAKSSNAGPAAPGSYRCLLIAYPRRFRERFGPAMEHTFVRQLGEARARGRLATAAFWARSAGHALLFGIGERLAALPGARGFLVESAVELRHAARRLIKHPGFTLAGVATLGLGIGANAAIYSVVHAVVISPLPYPDSERLLWIGHSAPGAQIDRLGSSLGAYVFYREHNQSFTDMTAYRATSMSLGGDGEPVRVDAALVTASFFDVFLDGPLPAGRRLTEADDAPGADRLAVISHSLWQQRYGGRPDAIGRSVLLEGSTLEIVGVMPRGFDVPTSGTQVWLAQQIDAATVRLGNFGPEVVGRLREGVTIDAARNDLRGLVPRLGDRFPGPAFEMIVRQGQLTPLVQTLKERIVGDVRQMLWILLATVGFVLLIACANVANLFLVRAEIRRREVAVRSALGASRGRVLGHFLAESLLLGGLGGVLGLGIAAMASRALVAFGPPELPRLHEIGIDGAVLAFTAGVALITGIAFGVLPALRRSPGDVVSCIRDGGRSTTAGRERQQARGALVVSQVALALVLLIGAGLMVRSFWVLQHVDPGFAPDSALTLRVSLPQASYPDRASATEFQHRVLDRLASLPGVRAVGALSCLPLDDCGGMNPVYEDGVPADRDEVPRAVELRTVTGDFLRGLGIPLLAGRGLERLDREEGTASAIVSESFAARMWPGQSAIGKRIHPDWPDEQPFTIVGIAGDTRMRLPEEPPEIVYLGLPGSYPFSTSAPHSLAFVLRTDGAPLALAEPARRAIWELDANVPISSVRALEELVAKARAPMAFTMALLLIAACVALALGAIGVYGVLAYLVSQRIGEIGVRLALGAEPARVRRMVLRQGAVVVGIGLAIGFVAALALMQAMSSVLYGVSAADPATYAVVVAGLAGIALLAAWVPARRAARIDPIESLRAE